MCFLNHYRELSASAAPHVLHIVDFHKLVNGERESSLHKPGLH